MLVICTMTNYFSLCVVVMFCVAFTLRLIQKELGCHLSLPLKQNLLFQWGKELRWQYSFSAGQRLYYHSNPQAHLRSRDDVGLYTWEWRVQRWERLEKSCAGIPVPLRLQQSLWRHHWEEMQRQQEALFSMRGPRTQGSKCAHYLSQHPPKPIGHLESILLLCFSLSSA